MLINRMPPPRARRPRLGQGVALLLSVIGFAAAACSGFVQASAVSVANTRDSTPRADAARADELEEVTLTLHPQGITPRRLVRHAGRFLLSVDNRTEVEKLTLRLEQADGTPLRVIEIPPTAVDWSEALDLAPGGYRLVEVEHPDWECFIEIKSKA